MNIYKKIILVLAILCLFTPLVISKGTLFPFVFGKAIVFQILAELMLAVYFLGLVKFPEFRPKLSALGIAIAVFFVVFFLSTIFGVDPYYSFWSKHERMEGLFNLLHYFAFFLVLTSVFRTREDWVRLLKASVIACVLVILYAFGQLVNLPGFIQAGVSGTLGNPSFLATYLVFNIFFALFVFLAQSGIIPGFSGPAGRNHKAGKPAGRWFYLGCFAVFNVILVFTGCRGAIYGQFFGLFLFAGLYGFFIGSKRTKRYVAGTLLLAIVLVALLFFFKESSLVQGNAVLRRVTDVSFQSATLQQRFAGWRTGLNAFTARPVLGWGPENYYIAFYKYMDPYFYGPAETFDRAHNKYVDLLVLNGILGFAAYIAIFAVIFWRILRTLAGNRRDAFSFWFLGLFAAFLVQNFLLFDMPASYLMFFLTLGFFEVAYSPRPESQEPSNVKSAAGTGTKTLHVLNFIFIPAIIYAIWWGNFRLVVDSTTLVKAFQAIPDYSKALEYSRELLKYPSFVKVEGRPMLAKYLVEDAAGKSDLKENKDVKEFALFLVGEFEKGIKESPLNFRYYLSLASVYNFLGQVDPAYYQKAEAIARQASEIFPRNIEILFKIFTSRAAQGDWPGAEVVINEILKKAPGSHIAHWYLALADFNQQRYDLAETEAEKALSLGFPYSGNFGNIMFLANLQLHLGNEDKAAAYFSEALKLAPDNPQLYAEIASVYYKAGNKVKAREWAMKILDINPALKDEVDKFLETLQ